MDNTAKSPHSVCIENRRQGLLSGVKEVLSYSDEQLALDTTEGKLLITGKDIKIGKFSSSERTLTFTGQVNCIKYSAPSVPLIKRIFK